MVDVDGVFGTLFVCWWDRGKNTSPTFPVGCVQDGLGGGLGIMPGEPVTIKQTKKHTEKWVNLHNKIRFTGAYSATTTHIVIIKQSQTNNNEKWIKKKKCILLVIFVRWTGMEVSYNVTHKSLRCTKQKFALYFLIDFIFILCNMFVRFMLLCISIIVIFLAIWHLL